MQNYCLFSPVVGALLLLPGCSTVAVPVNAPVNQWTRTTGIASSTEELPRSEQPAPGRRDIRDRHTHRVTITGYCPPRAELFTLADGRQLILRDPCSGPTELSLRVGGEELRVAVARGAYGVGQKRRVWPLSERQLLLSFSKGWWTHLFLIDVDKRTARRLALPRELNQVKDMEVGVAEGHIFIGGGEKRIAVGGSGCENPPPGVGCDPVPIFETRKNRVFMLYRPGE